MAKPTDFAPQDQNKNPSLLGASGTVSSDAQARPITYTEVNNKRGIDTSLIGSMFTTEGNQENINTYDSNINTLLTSIYEELKKINMQLVLITDVLIEDADI